MKKPTVITLVLSALVIIGCASTKSNFWGSEKDGLNLIYNQDPNTVFNLKYKVSGEQILEVMGTEQVQSNSNETVYNVRVVSAGQEKGLALEFEFIKYEGSTENMQGTINSDFSAVIGKKASLTLNSKGNTSDFKGFDKIPEVEIIPGMDTVDEPDYIFGVRYLFPTLPDKPVKIGDTWKAAREMEIPISTGKLVLSINYTYTLIDTTTMNGIKCLKIEGKQMNTGKGEGDSPQGPFVITGKGKGTEVINFAYKKGMLLSYEGNTTFNGNAEIMGMEIPLTFKIKDNIIVSF